MWLIPLLVFDIGCHVVSRLPHVGTVAVGHSFNYPMSDVLGCWVELENFVQVFVVDVIVDELLDKA